MATATLKIFGRNPNTFKQETITLGTAKYVSAISAAQWQELNSDTLRINALTDNTYIDAQYAVTFSVNEESQAQGGE